MMRIQQRCSTVRSASCHGRSVSRLMTARLNPGPSTSLGASTLSRDRRTTAGQFTAPLQAAGKAHQYVMPLKAFGSMKSAAPPTASDMLSRFIFCMNERDIEGMISCLSTDCVHHGLAYADKLAGRQEVQQFYRQLLRSLPAGVRLVEDDATGGDGSSAAIIWHLELDGRRLPFGDGTTFVRLGVDGLIEYVRESQEHLVKLSRAAVPVLGAAVPLFGLASFTQGPARSNSGNDTRGSSRAGSSPRAALSVDSSGVSPALSDREGSRANFGQSQSQSQSHTADKADKLRAELESLQAEKEALEYKVDESTQRKSAVTKSYVIDQPKDSSQSDAGTTTDFKFTPPAGYPFAADENETSSGSSTSSSGSTNRSGRPEIRMISLDLSPDYKPPPGTQQIQGGQGSAGQARPITPPVLKATSSNAPTLQGPPNAEETATMATVAMRDFTGVWIKDRAASDLESYARTLDLMKLGGLQKATAMNLLEGCEILEYEGGLRLKFLTVVPFFVVSEDYRVNETTRMPRRDLKPGQQTARLTLTPDGMSIAFEWGAPDAASLDDMYSIKSDGSLHVRSVLRVGNKVEDTLQVYRSADTWKPQNEWSNGAALGVGNIFRNPFSR